MNADDLIAFLIEEAQHRVINDERGKLAESAIAASAQNRNKSRPGKGKSLEQQINQTQTSIVKIAINLKTVTLMQIVGQKGRTKA
jgi:hypothetical protein